MTFTPQFAIAADLHLRIRTWADYPDLCGDAFYSFSQIIDQVNHFRVPLLLLGDLFDAPHPDATTVQFYASECQRCQSPIYTLVGNHDVCEETLGELRGAWGALGGRSFNKQVIEIAGRQIYGLDYLPRRELKDALAQVPTAIVATHQAWKDLQGPSNYQGELAWLPPYVTTLLTGDLHQTLIEKRGGVTVVSPGSACMQKIDEPPLKSFIWGGEETGAPGLSFRAQPLRTRGFHAVEIRDQEGFDLFADRVRSGGFAGDPSLPPDLRRPIVRVTYPRALQWVHSRVVELCRGWSHLFLNPRGEGGPMEVVVTTKATGESLLATVETLRGSRDAVYRSIERMLATPGKSPATVLEEMEKEFLETAACQS